MYTYNVGKVIINGHTPSMANQTDNYQDDLCICTLLMAISLRLLRDIIDTSYNEHVDALANETLILKSY